MGFWNNVKNVMWPNRGISAGYNPYFAGSDFRSDGSKYRKGIIRSGNAVTYDNRKRSINATNAYEESMLARAIIRRLVNIVIERGIRFRSKPTAEMLPGVPQNVIDEFSRQLTLSFHMYMSSKFFTTNGTMNGYQFQRHLALGQFRNGEYFVKFNRKKKRNPRQLSTLSFQAIDPNQIGGHGGYTSTGGYNEWDQFNNGIRRDVDNFEIAYSVRSRKNENGRNVIVETEVPAFLSNGRTSMVHGFIPEYVNQSRGSGVVSPFLQELQEMTDFDLSNIEKAIKQSQVWLASETDGEENSVDPFEGMSFGQDNIGYDLDNIVSADRDGITTEDSAENEIKYREMNEAQFHEPGATHVFDLPSGNKINPFGNTAPVVGYTEFTDGRAKYITAGCDMPWEMVMMKYGANYNANRATLLNGYRAACIYRDEIVSDALQPIVDAFAEVEIASGRLQAPGFSDPWMRNAWLTGDYIGAPMIEIDPLKKNKADKISIELGKTTLDRLAIEENGSDGTKNREELAVQLAELTTPPWNEDDLDTESDNDFESEPE